MKRKSKLYYCEKCNDYTGQEISGCCPNCRTPILIVELREYTSKNKILLFKGLTLSLVFSGILFWVITIIGLIYG